MTERRGKPEWQMRVRSVDDIKAHLGIEPAESMFDDPVANELLKQRTEEDWTVEPEVIDILYA